jgi:SAM-dependent methyltransferase
MATNDVVFAGSIPALYDRYLGPVLFRPFAEDLVRRLAGLTSGSLLEVGAGTGIVTQALAATLPDAVAIVATDLSPDMLRHAAAKPGMNRVNWQQADALALPFGNAAFDAVVAQFVAMFFADRPAAYREVRRVLKPGGRFVFNVWGSLADNPLPAAMREAMQRRYPADPPGRTALMAFGYHDAERVGSDLRAGGFTAISGETVTLPSRWTSARQYAEGICQGTPVRDEIEA